MKKFVVGGIQPSCGEAQAGRTFGAGSSAVREDIVTSFRFIHAADIHLDSPLRGLAGQEGSAAESIRTATRQAFERLVDAAVEERADFLVIAGDLYDGDWRDYRTGLFFVAQMGRLNQAGIPVYLLYGNHDAESQITKRLQLPQNVRVFKSRKPESVRLDELQVVLHGQSFRQRDVADNLARSYPDPVDGAFNVGVLHTGLGGMGGHENYAPCSLDDLVNKGYDYWALGHVHRTEVLHERPHVVFPGNLQGRHIRETGDKGAFLVAVENGEVVALDPLRCDVVLWSELSVDLGGATSVGDAVDGVRDAIETAVANADRLLACRIRLEGRTRAHGRLLAAGDQLLAEARAVALGLGEGGAWIEKVVVATGPAVEPGASPEREDAVDDLLRMLREAHSDESLLRDLDADIGELVRRLPREVRSDSEDAILKAAVDGDHAALIGGVTPLLSARLLEEED